MGGILAKLTWKHSQQKGTFPIPGDSFGRGSGPIFLDQLDCVSNEANLFECPKGEPLGIHTCSHENDVGVICIGMFCT